MVLTALQQIILGILQGITEWLPISSSGILALVMSNFFGITDIGDLISKLLLLHLGTFFAALIYFRKDVAKLIKTLFNYKKAGEKEPYASTYQTSTKNQQLHKSKQRISKLLKQWYSNTLVQT